MRNHDIAMKILLVLVTSLFLLTSCGTSNVGSELPELNRTTSDIYNFYFSNTPSPDILLAIEYVVDRGETPEGVRIFEVADPGETIYNFTEYSIHGTGPQGQGDYLIRVFNPLEYVWDTREDFYYVEGL